KMGNRSPKCECSNLPDSLRDTSPAYINIFLANYQQVLKSGDVACLMAGFRLLKNKQNKRTPVDFSPLWDDLALAYDLEPDCKDSIHQDVVDVFGNGKPSYRARLQSFTALIHQQDMGKLGAYLTKLA